MKLFVLLVFISFDVQARCKSRPVETISGKFEVRRIESVKVNCSKKGATESVLQSGCRVHLELMNKPNEKLHSYVVYSKKHLCSLSLGATKELSLESTMTDCCHYMEETTTGQIKAGGCDGPADEKFLRCSSAPDWKLVE